MKMAELSSIKLGRKPPQSDPIELSSQNSPGTRVPVANGSAPTKKFTSKYSLRKT